MRLIIIQHRINTYVIIIASDKLPSTLMTSQSLLLLAAFISGVWSFGPPGFISCLTDSAGSSDSRYSTTSAELRRAAMCRPVLPCLPLVRINCVAVGKLENYEFI